MSRALADLEGRKRILVARSEVLRLEIASEVLTLREGTSWSRAGLALMKSASLRSALLATLIGLLGAGRAARFARRAGIGIAVATLAWRLARGSRAGTPAAPPGATPPAPNPDSG